MKQKDNDAEKYDLALYALWNNCYFTNRLCDNWLLFSQFLEDVREYKKDHRFCRIDKNKPYGPDNYKWVSTIIKTKEIANLHFIWQRKIYYRNSSNKNIICKEWLDFDVFRKDVGEQPIGKQLRRLDNNKPYGPDNFRWI